MMRWKGRFVGLAIAMALTATGALADQAKLFGTVTDDTGAGVPDAKVILEPLDGGTRIEGVARGKNGAYLVPLVHAGRYAIKVEAPGLALASLKAEAVGLDAHQQKESKWKLDGPVRADKPAELRVEDGMEITCNLVVGKATEITTAAGEKTAVTSGQAYALLAQQVQKGDCAGALPQLEKFTVDNPAHARGFYLKGFCNAVLGHDDDALAALTKSRELDPGFAGINSLIGKIQARNKRFDEAEAAFKKELEGTAVPLETQVDALLSLGALQRDQGKDADAIATFEKVMAAAPNRPEAYVELSALYTKAGQPEKAAAILDKAKQAGADEPRALLNLGISYFNKKDFGHAESMFRRVIEGKASNPDLAIAYALLAKLQMRDGKKTDAIASMKKSLELDPAGRLAAETKDALKMLESKAK